MNYINNINIQDLVDSVTRIGDDLLRQWKSVEGVKFKKNYTYVTDSDLYADKELRKILSDFSAYPIYSEEDTKTSTGEDCWLIDPLDGTGAFVAGIPTWAISIALILGGEVRFGLMHFPVIKKTVHSEADGRDLKIIKLDNSIRREDFICVPSDVHKYYDIRFPGKVRSLGSCASQIYYVICGKACFSVLGFPRIWDFAAGLPLIRKAGGDIFNLKGESLSFSTLWSGEEKLRFPLIVGHRQSVKDIINMVKLK